MTSNTLFTNSSNRKYSRWNNDEEVALIAWLAEDNNSNFNLFRGTPITQESGGSSKKKTSKFSKTTVAALAVKYLTSLNNISKETSQL